MDILDRSRTVYTSQMTGDDVRNADDVVITAIGKFTETFSDLLGSTRYPCLVSRTTVVYQAINSTILPAEATVCKQNLL